MNEKKKILISGYYGFNNSGDDAILKAIVNELKKENDNIEITALSRNPDDTRKKYHVKAINRFSITNIIKEMLNSDLFISGGGSLLQDITSTRSIIYYIALIYIAKILNKQVMIYANGIGPIKRRFNRRLVKKVLEKVDLITLRDIKSKQTIEELDVNNKNVFVTADPVFTLKASDNDRIVSILESENVPLDKKLIGICIRDWKNTNTIEKVLPRTIEYIKENYDVEIVFIPMHYPDDLNISQKIINMSNHKCYIISNKYPIEDVMGIVKELDLIIAMRLHSLIYAAVQAVPMVGIVYDPKVEGFMNTIGMKSLCNLESLETVDLCSIIDNLWNNKDKVKKELEQKREESYIKSQENAKMAIDMLKSR